MKNAKIIKQGQKISHSPERGIIPMIWNGAHVEGCFALSKHLLKNCPPECCDMAQLGILGSILAQAAKDSESTVAALITSQQETIEKEVTPPKPELQKIPGKGEGRKHSKRPRRGPKHPSKDVSSSESSAPTSA